MHKDLGTVTLKTGETMQVMRVRVPDETYGPQIRQLLGHKGEIWLWQVDAGLNTDLPIDHFYYLLLKNGKAISNVTVVEHRGIGTYGHVWTVPEERRKGAADALMERIMADFHKREVRMMTLGTGFDSHPYRLYQKHEFKGTEDLNGTMIYYGSSEAEFWKKALRGLKNNLEVRPFDWTGFPSATALFCLPGPGRMRSAMNETFGPSTPEGPLLQTLKDTLGRPNGPRFAKVLMHKKTAVSIGYAQLTPDPRFYNQTHVLDLWSLPSTWKLALQLIEAMPLAGKKVHVYVDAESVPKMKLVRKAGFKREARLHGAMLAQNRSRLDVEIWAKEG
ncbi:MAG TPA: GNAT family N-acetyltransferase [Planctomycetota bacterium]|nr:GNAT family N-acetyltransferase [Planctomycetota bacterium]